MTTTHMRIATRVILVAVTANDLVVNRRNRKRNKHNEEILETLKQENEQLQRDLNASVNQSNYLIQLLNRNEIPVSEFDLIVLSNPDLV